MGIISVGELRVLEMGIIRQIDLLNSGFVSLCHAKWMYAESFVLRPTSCLGLRASGN